MGDVPTKEPQNASQIDTYRKRGSARMGPWTSHIWRSDPRHLAFLLARYKFCSKMLQGKDEVLEVGCGDGFGTPIVLQAVGRVHGIDFEPLVLEEAIRVLPEEWNGRCTFAVHDLLEGPVQGAFDAAYSLDVLEHIPPAAESRFMANLCASLRPEAVCILGTPNLEASRFASPASQEGHINLKTAASLRQTMEAHFENIFLFSMNDEVVHTGFAPMAHYLLAMGVGKLRSRSRS